MTLEILATRTAGAAENMAVDFLLLQRYPRPEAPRFRHYEWRGPAITFGYAQKIAFVRDQLATLGDVAAGLDLCRRPTGGGIVDHRDDWTYSLVIPRGHRQEEARATASYRMVHEALAESLRAQNVDAEVKLASEINDLESAGVCFQRAEIYDVVFAGTGQKIAGAAQKRNKHGLLFQGSISRNSFGGVPIDWDRFEGAFYDALAGALGARAEPVAWPDLDEEEVNGLAEQYSSPEWIENR